MSATIGASLTAISLTAISLSAKTISVQVKVQVQVHVVYNILLTRQYDCGRLRTY